MRYGSAAVIGVVAVLTVTLPEPVAYVRWRGTMPSFDGLPLSVDVTVRATPTDPDPPC